MSNYSKTNSLSNNTNSSNNSFVICPECNYNLNCNMINLTKAVFMCSNNYVRLILKL